MFGRRSLIGTFRSLMILIIVFILAVFSGDHLISASSYSKPSLLEKVDISTDSFKLFNEVVLTSYRYYVDEFSVPEKLNETLDKVEKYLYKAYNVKVELPEIPKDEPIYRALKDMNHVFDQLNSEIRQAFPNEPEKLSRPFLLKLFIESFCLSLDPYTVYLGPEAYKDFQEALVGGDFSGIGVYIGKPKDRRYILVIEPLEGTPAYRAGLRSGDLIVKIGRKDTEHMTLEQAQALIRGPRGTKVHLVIKRGDKLIPVDITRDFIHVNSVKYKEYTCPDGRRIAYLKIRFFGTETGREFKDALSLAKSNGDEAIIIDLRNNSGGIMESAVKVVGNFLPSYSVVVKLVKRGKVIKTYPTSNEHPDLRTPIVVLTNQFTASASEITAQVLKDYKRAVIVGEPTFGKNMVQTLFELKSGGVLKLSIAKYYTPSGIDIHKQKVQPDILVKMKVEDLSQYYTKNDLQLEKALNYICNR